MRNKLLITIVIILLVMTIAWFFNKNNFKYTLNLCNKATGECETIATFKELDTCQIMNERWGWKCNITDKSDLKCKVEEGVFAEAVCKKK